MDDITLKLNFTCHACEQERNVNFLKHTIYDISSIFNLQNGCIVLNFRFCSDNPKCIEKSNNLEEINNFIEKRIDHVKKRE